MNKVFNGLLVAALALCVLSFVLAFSNAFGADRRMDKAPVYMPAKDGSLDLIGNFTYEYTPGYEIKVCFAADPNPQKVRCLVHSFEDRKAFFIDLAASEGGT